MSKNGNSIISRQEILAGELQPDRQPARLLNLIEIRAAYLQAEARRAIEAYFLEQHQEFIRKFDLDYFQGIKMRMEHTGDLKWEVFEQYAHQWQPLLPDDPQLRAQVAHQFLQKYRLPYSQTPEIAAAFGLEDPEMEAAYQKLFGQPLSAAWRANSDDEPPVSLETESPDKDQPALAEAVRALEWVSLPGGAELFQRGDPGDALYILISGRVRVVGAPEEAGAAEHVLAEFGRGEVVGEMEVLTGEPRSATVYALRDSELVRLPQAVIYRLAEHYPQVMMRLNRILALRLRASSTSGRPGTLNLIAIAVLPASREVANLKFTDKLVNTLAGFDQVLHLNSARVDSELGAGHSQADPDGAKNSRLVSWLGEQETHYRYVIYEADAEHSNWTKRCLRQADRVLLVVRADCSPNPGRMEKEMKNLQLRARTELVLLHPVDTRQPSGTRNWLDRREVTAHYHVRLDGYEEDWQRLVRRLSKRALGLVLGGGGARGFAHIGVLRAFREMNLQFDLVGGTSMGSILGAAYAMGLDNETLTKISGDLSSPLKLFDFTLPLVSFFSSGKVTSALQQIFGDLQIEDLWRPYFCLSSSLTRAVPVVHTRGSLWQAVRASSAIPGIFAPMLVENELLVDGAVLNNLPIDVMENFNQGGPMMAVNVFPEIDLVKDYRFGPSVSGWRVLLDWLNPLGGQVQAPSIFENLLRVVALNDVHQAKAKRDLVDLYIRPPVERFGILDFSKYKQIIQIGYETTQQELAVWKRSPQAERVLKSRPATPVRRLSHTLKELEMTLERLEASERELERS